MSETEEIKIQAKQQKTEREFESKLRARLEYIYGVGESSGIQENVLELARKYREVSDKHEFAGSAAEYGGRPIDRWSSADALLITYGDSIRRKGESPLDTLEKFLHKHVGENVSSLHILPFFPFTSDDGFAVSDYNTVNPELGDWTAISRLAKTYRFMSDLVINHCSASHRWFKQFLRNESPGKDFFITEDPEFDQSRVVRPRSFPLFSPYEVINGEKQTELKVWTTFGRDQVDLDFSNPAVLLEFVRILLLYMERGVQIIRLDAVGFMWKESGDSCIHHPKTHEIIKLIRLLFDYLAPRSWLITETNVPNKENLSYFGNRDEAHLIYNFSLPPLLINTLIRGDSTHLNTWMMSMPPSPFNCAYLNFTASHDGIGLRPAEGLLEAREMEDLLGALKKFGALITTRKNQRGMDVPYEINISLFEALKGTLKGEDEYQFERFIASQAIMLALEGVPAFYIHSLLATPNDVRGVEESGMNRRINRHKWDVTELETLLTDPESDQSRVLAELMRLLNIRRGQKAFHPNATQFTLRLGPEFFAFWRQSFDREQSIFVVSNITVAPRRLDFARLNLIGTDNWYDLVSGAPFPDLYSNLTMSPYQTLWLTNQPGRSSPETG